MADPTALASLLAPSAPKVQSPAQPPAASPRSAQSLRHAAEDFESLFLGLMYEHMFTSLDTDGLFGGGQGETIYRSMLVQEYAKVMSRTGGIGISDSVYRELIKAQESFLGSK